MNEKKKLRKQMTEESIRNLQSISGQDLINRVFAFDARLQKLINEQLLPPALIIGALMGHVYRLQSRDLVNTLEDTLREVGEYFVTKEQFNILLKLVKDITEKLEEKPFKAKVE